MDDYQFHLKMRPSLRAMEAEVLMERGLVMMNCALYISYWILSCNPECGE
jgi:hypothetical protein